LTVAASMAYRVPDPRAVRRHTFRWMGSADRLAVPLPPEVLPVATDRVLVREGEQHRVSYRVPIPYFGFLWRPLVARRARRIEAAADAGRPLPSDLPWWAPPEQLDERASVALAGACLITLLWSYGGGTLGLLSQTLPYAAEIYDVGDRALGT
jgi:hypothetical protein